MQPNGPRWRCYEKRREYRKEADRRYWYKPDGGYIKERQRDLVVQRQGLLARMEQLNQEVQALAES